MIKTKLHNPANTPEQFISAAWIAHNTAMEGKRELLRGAGVKPVIGSTYTAPFKYYPAFFAPKRAPRAKVWPVVRDSLALVGAVGVFAFFAFAGGAVFL